VREGARGGSTSATCEVPPTTARLRARGGATTCKPVRGGRPVPRVTSAGLGCECVIRS
jgi:hypothetical protein